MHGNKADACQANEDGLACSPYTFDVNVVNMNKRYTLRHWIVDRHSAAGGYYDTGMEIFGDVERAVAHQTFPVVEYGNLQKRQRVDTGKTVDRRCLVPVLLRENDEWGTAEVDCQARPLEPESPLYVSCVHVLLGLEIAENVSYTQRPIGVTPVIQMTRGPDGIERAAIT